MVRILFFVSCFSLLLSGLAQEENKANWWSSHPLEFSLGSNSISLPFKNFLGVVPFYPQFNVGLQHTYREKNNFSINQSIGLGLAFHPYHANRYFLDSHLRFKQKILKKFYAQAGIGLAFSLNTYPNTVFELNNNGIYEKAGRFTLKPQLYAGLLMETGYVFPTESTFLNNVYLRYQTGVAGKYHPSIFVLPVNSFQLGIQFKLNKDKS